MDYKLEIKIALYVLEFLETKEEKYKIQAKEYLLELSKFYNFKPKNCHIARRPYDCLKDFLKNNSGYVITITNLYNSLK